MTSPTLRRIGKSAYRVEVDGKVRGIVERKSNDGRWTAWKMSGVPVTGLHLRKHAVEEVLRCAPARATPGTEP